MLFGGNGWQWGQACHMPRRPQCASRGLARGTALTAACPRLCAIIYIQGGLGPARAPKQQFLLAPCKERGRFPAHEEDCVCLPSGSVGSILGKAMSTTDFWNTVKQTNKQTNRAGWEPAAASGKCMAGVPAVFRRPQAVLWELSTLNPAWVPRKTHTSKII